MNIQGADFNELEAFSETTVATIIARHVAVQPERPAIVVSKDKVLTWRALGARVEAFGTGLRAHGLGPSARVAIILPDGLELAVAIVATACHAVAVPLNPKLTAIELGKLFERLHIEAIVTSSKIDTVTRDVAARLGICLLEVSNDQEDDSLKILPAIRSPASNRRQTLEIATQPNTLALILQTSATTGQPKLVPVTHRFIVLNADRRRQRFNLTHNDRTLCAIPLYYGQGLNELFAALLVGGSVACPDRGARGTIIDWIIDLQPTWYAGAGQAFHMNVLECTMARQEKPLRHCLRFIRSGGAPLSVTLRQRLEELFGVPILETYTFTEVAIVATNSIVPEDRKSGTVGRPWPNEVAIRAEDGRLLPPGESGEIVVRGPGLMHGYLDDDEANRAAFVDGWFRTGDVGLIDAEGFLTLSGRLKEYINRGGEKISPNEVELALLLHPYVREAVAFSVPHPRLGESVAAAVVLMPGTNATPTEIRNFLSDHLAPFKIPQRVFLKEQIPKGPTGKPLRRQLAKAATDRIQSVVPAASPLQVQILEIWRRLLGRSDIGIDDDFFEAGGDSLLSIQMLCEVEAIARQQISASSLRDVYTVRELNAAVLRRSPATSELMTCAKEGHGKSFLFCHGDFETRGLYALNVADALTCDQCVFLLHPHIDPDPRLTIEEMARTYIPHVLSAQPTGAIRLGGACNGGLVAWEIACQLNTLGREVEFVVLFETISLNARPILRAIAKLVKLVVAVAPKKISEKFERDGMSSAWSRGWRHYPLSPYSWALRNYIPAKLKTRLICVLSEESHANPIYSAKQWTNLTPEVNSECVSGTHLTYALHTAELARLLDRLLK
jgi:oxalate---CoA ligase